MPKYLVLRDTLVPSTGRIHRAGEEVVIEWPTFGKDAHSSEPKRLDDNLELIKPEKAKASKGGESGDGLV